MQLIRFAFILLLLIPIIAQGDSVDLSNATFQVYYSKYNGVEQEWTNMTINGNGYKISSDNSAYDGFESDFLMNPWDLIAVELNNSKFFETKLMEEDPHTVLEINYLDKSNIHSISQVDIGPDGIIPLIDSIIPLIDSIFYRVTGYTKDFKVWPVDMHVSVMESYPERYRIFVKFQRGNDLLDYVHEENVTLVVSTYNIFKEPITAENKINALHTDTEKVTINAGGMTAEINYTTFILGKNYTGSKLHFTILMENGIYLYYSMNNTDLPVLNFQGYNNTIPVNLVTMTSIEDDETISGRLELPIPIIFMVAALLLLPIIRKKYPFLFVKS